MKRFCGVRPRGVMPGLVAVAVLGVSACSTGSVHTAAVSSGGASTGTSASVWVSASPVTLGSSSSVPSSSSCTGTASGSYGGPVRATIVNTVAGQQATTHGSGRITLTYSGGTVTGTVNFVGSGTGPDGAEAGTLRGNVSGSAASPMLTGTVVGTGGNSPFTVSLNVTTATCSAVSGDLVALFRAIYAYYHASAAVSLSGTGAWKIPHL